MLHMPWGEMTIALHDVHLILDLPISGSTVTHRIDRPSVAARVQEFFAFTEEQMVAGGIRRRGLSHRDLRVQCQGYADEYPLTTASGFLMYLLGSTLFTDKSQHKISPDLLILVDDLDEAMTRSWATATLAYLYRRLGEATRVDCRQMCGCLTLLQV